MLSGARFGLTRKWRYTAVNARAGAIGGFTFGLFFLAVGVAIAVVSGGRNLEQNEVKLAELAGLYLGAGIAAGVIVGTLWPLSGSWPGAVIIGFVAAVPVAFAGMLVVEGPPSSWDADARGGFVVSAITFGIMGAVSLRPRRDAPPESGANTPDQTRAHEVSRFRTVHPTSRSKPPEV